MLMTLRACSLHIGIPYQTLSNYWWRIQGEVPYIAVGSAKLVDPEMVRAKLLMAGYKFKQRGLEGITNGINENDVYDNPQTMLDDLKSGKLYEDEP